MAVRVTQTPVEVVQTGDTVRVSQAVVEAVQKSETVRVSQVVLEAVYKAGDDDHTYTYVTWVGGQ